MKKIIAAVMLIAAFMAVKNIMEMNREHEAIEKAKASLSELKDNAVKKRPDVSVSEAVRLEAVEQASAKISGEPDKNKRLISAVGNFMGFYLVNTRERLNYCHENGVDISSFVHEFERVNESEYEKAKGILAGTPYSEERLYVELQSQFRGLIAQDMKDMASAQGGSVEGACKFLEDNGREFAEKMHILKIQPVVYQTLMEG